MFKVKIKNWISLLLVVLLILCIVGCGEQTPTSNKSKSEQKVEEIELTDEEKEAQKDFNKSTAKNDTDLGLRNVKLDKLNSNISKEQKMIIDYFDEDYLSVPNYEFLRRYPNVYNGAQIKTKGFVKKVLSATNDKYKLVLWLVQSKDAFFYRSDDKTPEDYEKYINDNANSFVIIEGVPSGAWFIENDFLQVYGRYTGVETIEIDGTSFTVPTINANKAFISSDLGATVRYDLSFVKTIAKTIFGNDIEVRNPIADTDYKADMEWRVIDEKPFYIVELENQSNSKFTKYRFYTSQGCIEDAKTGSDFWLLGTDENVKRNIAFSADFEHFFLFTYDIKLETLNLDYYDKDLKKIWNREFEETTNAVFDYTKNNIYLIANNELYIINTKTGEDTFNSSFIGEKKDIRKLSDGILSVGEKKSDAIIKNDLNGNMIWKTNLVGDVERVEGIQVLNETIIIQAYLTDGLHYVVLNNQTGEVIADAISISN